MASNDDFNVDDEGGFSPHDAAWPADEEGSSSTFMFLSPAEEDRAVTELYGVFRRPRNDADRRAGEFARRWGALDFGVDRHDESGDPELRDRARAHRAALGDVIEDEGRLVVTGLGGGEDMLYVAPTTTEAVAHAVLPNGGGGCGHPGPDGLVLATVNRRGSFVAHGLIADAIAAVDVVVNGEAWPARMGKNAFGVRIEGVPAIKLEKLILHRVDGTTSEIDLHMPKPGDFDRPPGDSS